MLNLRSVRIEAKQGQSRCRPSKETENKPLNIEVVASALNLGVIVGNEIVLHKRSWESAEEGRAKLESKVITRL
jgi:hypothetical protein